MKMVKEMIKRKSIKILLIVIRPFIIPILVICILLALVSSITDVFYIAFNNEDKIDMKNEMKYYDAEKEYEKEEMKGFLASVWDFVEKIFGGGEMSTETDWPVERILFNFKWIWSEEGTNIRSINNS